MLAMGGVLSVWFGEPVGIVSVCSVVSALCIGAAFFLGTLLPRKRKIGLSAKSPGTALAQENTTPAESVGYSLPPGHVESAAAFSTASTPTLSPAGAPGARHGGEARKQGEKKKRHGDEPQIAAVKPAECAPTPRKPLFAKDLWLLRGIAVQRLVESHVHGDEEIHGNLCSVVVLKRLIWEFLDDRPKFVATGCTDGQARIFDLRTGKHLVSVRHDVRERKTVNSVLLAPGPNLLTGSWDGQWHKWQQWPQTPERPSEFARGEKSVGHDNIITGMAMTRSGLGIVAACSSGRVLVYRAACPIKRVTVADRDVLQQLGRTLKMGDHNEFRLTADFELSGVKLRKDDELLNGLQSPESAFVSKDGKEPGKRDLLALEPPFELHFRFYGCLTQGHIRSYHQLDHGGAVLCMAISSEGQGEFIYSGSRDRLVWKWNLETGSCVHTYTGHGSMVRCVAVNCRYVVSGGDDRTIKVWRKDVPELLRTITGHDDFVRAVSLCPTFPDRLASAGEDKLVALWDVSTGARLAAFPHSNAVTAVWLRESALVSAGGDKFLRVWHTESAEVQDKLRHLGDCTAISVL